MIHCIIDKYKLCYQKRDGVGGFFKNWVETGTERKLSFFKIVPDLGSDFGKNDFPFIRERDPFLSWIDMTFELIGDFGRWKVIYQSKYKINGWWVLSKDSIYLSWLRLPPGQCIESSKCVTREMVLISNWKICSYSSFSFLLLCLVFMKSHVQTSRLWLAGNFPLRSVNFVG